MADASDVRRIAERLPETTSGVNDEGQIYMAVLGKGVAWTWMERVEAKQPRVPRPDVLAVRVPNADDKQALLASDDHKFFTEPHYEGFPAILVRLPEVDAAELEELLVDAWRSKAPKKLQREAGI